ncbi:MAG: AzlC family ABC transporter permease [Thermoplasmatota archaeon]
MARHPIIAGALRALTLAPGIVPLGALVGASAVAAGFDPGAAVLLSALVFAGGSQFAAVALVAAGGAVAAAVTLFFFINSRYFLICAAALDLARRSGASAPARWLIALGVVDESFALQAAWDKKERVPVTGLIAISATLWLLWVGSTALGAFAGPHLPDIKPFGLDYVLPGLFIGLLGVFADTRAKLVAGLAALAVAGALALFGFGVAAVLVVPPIIAFGWGQWSK